MVPASYAILQNMNLKGKEIMFGSILIALMDAHTDRISSRISDDVKMGLINSCFPQILPFITNAFAIFFTQAIFYAGRG